MDLGIRRLFDGTFMDENGIIHPTNPKKTGGASGFEEKLLESFSNKKARPDSEFDLVKFLAYVETCNIDIDTIAADTGDQEDNIRETIDSIGGVEALILLYSSVEGNFKLFTGELKECGASSPAAIKLNIFSLKTLRVMATAAAIASATAAEVV